MKDKIQRILKESSLDSSEIRSITEKLLSLNMMTQRQVLIDYNDFLNFEYAQFGLNHQDIDGFESSRNSEGND